MDELTGTERKIVLELDRYPDQSASGLSDKIDVSRRAITNNLEDMNEMGLVTKHKVIAETSWRWGWRLIEDRIDIKREWTNFLPDIVIMGVSLVVSSLFYYFTQEPSVIIGAFMPVFMFMLLTIYRLDRVGENKTVLAGVDGR